MADFVFTYYSPFDLFSIYLFTLETTSKRKAFSIWELETKMLIKFSRVANWGISFCTTYVCIQYRLNRLIDEKIY